MQGNSRRERLPSCLYIETTNRCNLKCKTCINYRGRWESERDISLEELMMISEQLPGLERCVLHGIGEPLLNKDLTAMIQYLKRRKVTVVFNTNGILLDKENQEALIDSSLDELRVSLDAATSSGYKAVRGSDKFDLIISNVREFAKRLHLRKSSRPKLSLWFVGERQNIAEFPGLIEIAAALGVKEVHLQRLVYFLDNGGYGLARAKEALTNPDGGVYELIVQCQDRARELGIIVTASGLTDPAISVQGGFEEKAPWQRCLRPWELIYVTASGNVLPCCISPFSTADYASLILGNVFDSKVADIWFGLKYQAFRKRHQSPSPPKFCLGCGTHWSL